MSLHRAAWLCALLLALACAKPSLPPLDADTLRDSEREALESYRTLRTRLFRIDYALRVGGRRFCEDLLAPDAGLLLGAPARAATASADPDGSAGLDVLDVVPSSPLDRAGVRPGDRLLELDGRPLRSVAQFNERLERTAQLRFRHGSELLGASAELTLACAIPVQLSRDPSLMTFESGAAVAVPYGLLQAVDDRWLAIAVAHQLAHALTDLAAERVPDPEAIADHLGLLLAAEAGFDVGIAPAFWEWLAAENPWRIPSTRAFRLRRPGSTPGAELEYPAGQLHLGIGRRLPAIRASVDQIRDAQERRAVTSRPAQPPPAYR